MVQGEPLVSVVMATRNGSRFIREAVDSVLVQTYHRFEFLIIDDGSIDDSSKIVEALGDGRIRLMRNDKALGLTRSLNQGLKVASGKYIARIDDDDVWVDKDKLEQQVTLMQKTPRLGVCGVQNIVIDEAGNELYRLRYPTSDADIRRRLLARNLLVHSGVLIRRSALRDVGNYDERRRYAQDYELWLRLGTKYQLANLADPYVKQRINPRGVTGRHNMRQFVSFVRIAWEYRTRYPGFWHSVPIYVREALVNLLPKPVFYKIATILRKV